MDSSGIHSQWTSKRRAILRARLAGKREWEPVKIVKEWGAASPQALTAYATNEVLSEVVIEFKQDQC